jgi:hypothetical protein
VTPAGFPIRCGVVKFRKADVQNLGFTANGDDMLAGLTWCDSRSLLLEVLGLVHRDRKNVAVRDFLKTAGFSMEPGEDSQAC